MERHQTILPSQPTLLTSLRAALGAVWFYTVSLLGSVLRALHRAVRPQHQMAPVEVQSRAISAALEAPACDGKTLPLPTCVKTAQDDKWLRSTAILTQAL